MQPMTYTPPQQSDACLILQCFQFPKRDKDTLKSPSMAAAACGKGPSTAVLAPKGSPPKTWHPQCSVVQVYSSSRGVDHNPQLFLILLPASSKAGN